MFAIVRRLFAKTPRVASPVASTSVSYYVAYRLRDTATLAAGDVSSLTTKMSAIVAAAGPSYCLEFGRRPKSEASHLAPDDFERFRATKGVTVTGPSNEVAHELTMKVCEAIAPVAAFIEIDGPGWTWINPNPEPVAFRPFADLEPPSAAASEITRLLDEARRW